MRSLVVIGGGFPDVGGRPPPIWVDPQRFPFAVNVNPLIECSGIGVPITVTAPVAGFRVPIAPLFVEIPVCPPSPMKIVGVAGCGTVLPETLNSLARLKPVAPHPLFVPVVVSAMGNCVPGRAGNPHPMPVWRGSVGTSESQYCCPAVSSAFVIEVTVNSRSKN